MGNWLDKSIGYLSPSWGEKREAARTRQRILSSYNGAVSTRLDNTWASSTSATGSLPPTTYQLAKMRDRARSLERNNAIADGMLTRATDNIVGRGFQLQSTANNPKWDDAKNREWNKRAEDLFYRWADRADIRGLTWAEHQNLQVRGFLRDGDDGAILVGDPKDPTYAKLQAVEGDQIVSPLPSQKRNGLTVVDGVEINGVGTPIAYYVNTVDEMGKATTARIPAQDFLFFARRKRTRQVRGETCFATTFGLLDQIDKWIEANVVAARMQACFGIAITKNNPPQWTQNLDTVENIRGQNQRSFNFEPGMVQVLEPGESLTPIAPTNPQQSFPDNLNAMLRIVGTPLGMPLELVLMDYSRTNYSSAKASMEQAYRTFRWVQQLFIDSYLTRVYEWRVSKFIKAGLLEENPDAFNHRWIAEPWPYLNKSQDLMGDQMEIDLGVATEASLCTARGLDYEEMQDQRARELRRRRELGMPIYHSSSLQQVDAAKTPPAANNTNDNTDNADTGDGGTNE